MDNKGGLYTTGIIGVVAIIGIVVMVLYVNSNAYRRAVSSDALGKATAVTCNNDYIESCYLDNAVSATRTRKCIEGVLSSFDVCTPKSCNIGYYPSGNICVSDWIPEYPEAQITD